MGEELVDAEDVNLPAKGDPGVDQDKKERKDGQSEIQEKKDEMTPASGLQVHGVPLLSP